MASRKEEKEQRRRERVEKERQHEESLHRRKVVAGVITAVVAIAVVVVVVVVVVGGGNDGGKPISGSSNDGALDIEAESPPDQKIADLDEAASKAGCTLKSPEDEGDSHIDPSAKTPKYNTNPPASGDHSAEPLEDGAHSNLEKESIKNSIHSLEHGRVIYQYRGISQKQRQQLLGLFEENKYHVLIFENKTDMPYQVAGVGWTELLLCKKMNNATFDALRAFRDEFVDKGPELVP